MALNAQQRTARARKAADARHHPDADPADLERQRIDRAIAAIVTCAPKMTDEQAQRLTRMLTHPCRADSCRHRVGFYEQFCGLHRNQATDNDA